MLQDETFTARYDVVESPVRAQASEQVDAFEAFRLEFRQVHFKGQIRYRLMQAAKNAGLVTLDVDLDEKRHAVLGDQSIECGRGYGPLSGKIECPTETFFVGSQRRDPFPAQ